MSDVRKERTYRRQRSIYQVHYALKKSDEYSAHPFPWGIMADLEIQAYNSQVAGHRSTEGAVKYIGLLQSNYGTIMKPVMKELHKREVDFYEKLANTNNNDLIELRSYIPKYKGCKKFVYNGHENDYIILEDLATKMMEPCIMDVKVGRRTWDPLATEQKIANENLKYARCKQEYSFCIPGYQVYKLPSGRLQKYGKEYGKKLYGEDVKQAIKNYLNEGAGGLCRSLIMQFLTELWKIHSWARKQTSVRLFSSSLLLVYDANSLRACCGDTYDHTLDRSERLCFHQSPFPKRRHSTNSLEISGSNFSGQLTAAGPRYKKLNSVPLSPISMAQSAFSPHKPTTSSPWNEAFDRIVSNYFHERNYDDAMTKMKVNYRTVLDQLSEDKSSRPWASVKIIDFAHAFFNGEHEAAVDDNFREGVANFVRIFEELLWELRE